MATIVWSRLARNIASMSPDRIETISLRLKRNVRVSNAVGARSTMVPIGYRLSLCANSLPAGVVPQHRGLRSAPAPRRRGGDKVLAMTGCNCRWWHRIGFAAGAARERTSDNSVKAAFAPARHSASPGPFAGVRPYLRIARPDHWIKNVFVIPGMAAALAVAPHAANWPLVRLGLALLVVCLVASANYAINEFLDAPYDRHHPLKSDRPGAQGLLDGRLVLVEYLILAACGAGIATQINFPFYLASLALLAMGILYNTAPIRTKDKPYLDVVSESVNNPIRFLLGWFAVTGDFLPPASVLLAYWMGGAF
ncbi:MAG: UbiA family prenyltransferase, partial [Alphaproteobacteria bacterium]|nr:UbiA family prenyltransferase [Alphaproteobacteria bacterium]